MHRAVTSTRKRSGLDQKNKNKKRKKNVSTLHLYICIVKERDAELL